MKAILFTGREQAAYKDIAEPSPGPGQVLIRVRASGVCHTDHDILIGNYGRDAFPLVPGHEFSGEVIGLGSGVSGFSEGDRVAVDPNFACGTCRACARGFENLCDQLGAYGVTVNGGFEPMVAVAAENVHPIGGLSFCAAALAEPMGCVLNGVSAIGLENVDNALIFGAGPMGMLIAFALRTYGVGDITMVDLSEDKLRLVEDMGFAALHASDPGLQTLRHSHDLAADATGSSRVAQGLIQHVANGGKALFFSVYPQQDQITLSPYELFRRQIRVGGSHSLSHANFKDAIDVISSAGPTIEKVVSHRVDLPEALEKMAGAPSGGAQLKVQAEL